jgi:hypothetical protein
MLLSALLPSWKLALDSAKRLEAYLAAEGIRLESPSLRAFLAAERDRTSPASAARHYCFFGAATFRTQNVLNGIYGGGMTYTDYP